MRDIGHSEYVHVKKTIEFPVCFVTVAPFDLTQTFPTIINSQRDAQIRKQKQKNEHVHECARIPPVAIHRGAPVRLFGSGGHSHVKTRTHAHARLRASLKPE